MMFRKIEKTVASTDGVHTLRGAVYLPDGEIKGLVQIVHGMQEHIGRYEPFMAYLAQRGFLVFGYDHLGHGQTARSDEELGYFAAKHGHRYLVEDVHAFYTQVRAQHPGHPFILFGHSMGSFIVRLVAAKYGQELDGLIICGTGGPNAMAGAGIALSKIIQTFRGKKHISNTLKALAFSKFNERFGADGEFGWISRDPDIRSAYAADPFCSFSFTTSAMGDLVQLNRRCNQPACYEQTPAQLPIFLISGTDDPVGGYGEGVKEVYEAYRRRGVAHVSMKLYEGCRHEILNELNREEVYADILSFLYTVV